MAMVITKIISVWMTLRLIIIDHRMILMQYLLYQRIDCINKCIFTDFILFIVYILPSVACFSVYLLTYIS